MKRSNFATMGFAAAALGVLAFALPSQAGQPWKSEDVDRDFTGECNTSAVSTNVAAAPGGRSCYGSTLFITSRTNILRVRVSTTGDTHGGAALQMACRIRPATSGVWSFCNPSFTGGDGVARSYIVKNKLPTSGAANNCNDGSGGTADCHDNSIEQTWCVDVVGNDTFDIDVRIASDPEGGGDQIAWIEASTFLVSSTKLVGGCGGIDAEGDSPF